MLITILVALVLGFLAKYVAERAGLSEPLPILIGVLVGLIVFFNPLF